MSRPGRPQAAYASNLDSIDIALRLKASLPRVQGLTYLSAGAASEAGFNVRRLLVCRMRNRKSDSMIGRVDGRSY
jgi:hypothetical protein